MNMADRSYSYFCGGACAGWQSVLDPQSEAARHLANLFWLFVAVCAAVWLLVLLSLGLVLLRQRFARPEAVSRPHPVKAVVVTLLVIVTAGILSFLSAISFFATRGLLQPDRGALSIKVTGHQWWWDVEYQNSDPTQTFRTANEIHIPVGRTVLLDLEANDVIHSFWVPNLMGKQDMIPGRKNSLALRAEHPGLYRSQ